MLIQIKHANRIVFAQTDPGLKTGNKKTKYNADQIAAMR
jgi:hypothetical protein